jgi:DNA-binding HxlR family transcriptional regulator
MKNNFRYHRATKARHRDDIIRLLRTKPSTFTDLLTATKLSRPTLTNHLKELVTDALVEHDDETRTYSLTQRGKTVELLGTNLVSAGLKAAGRIIHDSNGAELLANMARMAKEDPEMFQIIMDWGLDLALLVASDPVFQSRWVKATAGDRESWAPFQEEIRRRTTSAQPKNLEEFRAALDDIQAGIRQVLENEKRSKSTR